MGLRVTDFYLSGNLSTLRENDILSITSIGGTERIKVLNVDLKNSKIRALRQISGIGISHFASDSVVENSRSFIINSNTNKNFSSNVDKQIYFNPSESVGLGTTSGVGITTTLFFDSI